MATTWTDIVFDADCVLCSGMVHFVLRHERAPTTRFISAWSATGLRIAAEHGLSRADLDETYLVVEDGRAFTRSDGGLVILRHLRAPWSWLAIFWLVPRFARDAIYATIARHRYQWFGHKPQCFVPPKNAAARFINS